MRAFLEQQKYLIDYTLAALLRRKTRNIGLLLVYTLLVFLFASALLLGQGLRREAAILLQDAPEVIVQRLVAGRHDLLPAAWLETLRRIRGVGTVQGRLWGYYYDPAVKANYTLMVAPERPLAKGEIVVGAALARVRQIGIGDYLGLRAANGQPLPLKVTGILDTRLGIAERRPVVAVRSQFPRAVRLPAGCLYRRRADRAQSPGSADRRRKNRAGVPR
ncbi:MAG: hypothetical protein V9G98_07410 [Candidatus Competibacter sp.]